MLVQLVPLPLAWLERVSPAAAPLLGNIDFAYGAGLLRFHPASIDPPATATALALYVCFASMLLGLTRAMAVEHARRTVEALTLVGVLLALVGIVQKPLYSGFVLGVWEPQRGGSPFGPFVNKNHFAGWMLMAIPLVLALLCAGLEQGMRGVRPGIRNRILWLSSPEANRLILLAAAAMLMALALILTMSRSGISALAIALMLTGWVAARGFTARTRRTTMLAYLLLLFVTSITWVGADTIVTRFSAADWSEFNNRRGAWTDALSVSTAFPLTGTGINTYSTAARFYQRHDVNHFFGEAHNDYLQLLAEGGLLVLVPLAALAALLLVEIRRRAAEDARGTTWWLRRGAVTAMVAIALQETVEFSLQMPGNFALFAVVCAIALHRPAEHRAAPPQMAPRGHRPILRVVASNSLAGSR